MSYTYTGTNAVEGRGTRVEGSEADQGRARKLPDGSQPLELAGLWLRHRLQQLRRGFVYVRPEALPGEMTACLFSETALDARNFPLGMVEVPVATLWAQHSVEFKAEPLRVAVKCLGAPGNYWGVLFNSAVEVEGRGSRVEESEVRSPIVGGDPAANELDPDLEEAPKFAQALEDFRDLRELDRIEVETRKQVQVQAQVLGLGAECPRHSPTLVDVVAEVPVGDLGGPSRARCLEEGRVLARERLDLGMRPNELRKAVFTPCPYTLGTPERVWWLFGFLEVVQAAEDAAA